MSQKGPGMMTPGRRPTDLKPMLKNQQSKTAVSDSDKLNTIKTIKPGGKMMPVGALKP